MEFVKKLFKGEAVEEVEVAEEVKKPKKAKKPRKTKKQKEAEAVEEAEKLAEQEVKEPTTVAEAKSQGYIFVKNKGDKSVFTKGGKRLILPS